MSTRPTPQHPSGQPHANATLRGEPDTAGLRAPEPGSGLDPEALDSMVELMALELFVRRAVLEAATRWERS